MKTISIPFTSEVIANNQVNSVEQKEDGELMISIEAILSDAYQPVDSEKQYSYKIDSIYTVMVQELGLPHQKVRYQVAAKLCHFTDDNGIKHHFSWPVPGLSLRLGLSEAVMNKMVYFLKNPHLSLEDILIFLDDLYQVQPTTGVFHFLQSTSENFDDRQNT